MRKHAKDRAELKSIRKKQQRYNKVIAIIIACKHRNSQMLSYLLGNENFNETPENTNGGVILYKGCENSKLVRRQLRQFWTKKDLSAMIHFITNHMKIWEFAVPLIFHSSAAYRWFY